MDDARFDRFARAIADQTSLTSLTSPASRRGLLGVAAALPVVGSLLVTDAAAKRRKRDRKHDRDDVQDEKRKKRRRSRSA